MVTEEYLRRWIMDNLSTFLELPLERKLYKTKIIKHEKPPIRILITEGNSKAAHHLMYYLCSGQVFGPDQKIIVHLINAKGFASHKGILLDIEECGFVPFTDFVVSAKPEVTYGDVDVVVMIAFFEELSGHTLTSSLIHQVTKVRNVVNNMRLYSKPDAKLVICGPSTKGVVILLTCLRTFEPKMPIENVTAVTLLDETIAKNHIGAKLKVTTDKIKNVVVWGATSADVHNATVSMYPPDDTGHVKKVNIPLLEALNDHQWLHDKFSKTIHRRLSNPDLMTFGGAVATATARHLKYLFQGTNSTEEIVSMGVIVPPSEPYGFRCNYGISFPVVTENGKVAIREEVQCDTNTHLMNIKSMYRLQQDTTLKFLYEMLDFIAKYEKSTKERFIWTEHTGLWSNKTHATYLLRCIISPRVIENTAMEKQELPSKKSITWEEGYQSVKGTLSTNAKSSLRFNV